MATIFWQAKNVAKQKMECRCQRAHGMHLKMLPSNGTICSVARGWRQVNRKFFELWLICCAVWHRVNMEQRLQHTLFIQTFRVVPEVVCAVYRQ